jgi:hypothetical protein
MDAGDVFDQLAFIGMKPKEIIVKITKDVQKSKPFPTRSDIESHVAALVARYGGKLAGMTRKNLVSAVERKLRLNERRRWDRLYSPDPVKSNDGPSA